MTWNRSSRALALAVAVIVLIPAAHAQQKSWFNTSEQLVASGSTPRWLVSDNRAFYAIVEPGRSAEGLYGGLEIHMGSGPEQDFGRIWQSRPDNNIDTRQGPFFLAIQPDANLCVYHGSSPSDIRQPLHWCSMVTKPLGEYFVAMQGDGNLCVYAGNNPGANKGNVWCSNTARQVTWRPDSKPLSFPSTGRYGSIVREYLCASGGSVTTSSVSSGCAYWIFEGGMVKPGGAPGSCLTHEADGSLSIRGCVGFSGQLNWALAADKTLRKSDFPDGCVEPKVKSWSDGAGTQWTPPMMNKPCEGGAKFDY